MIFFKTVVFLLFMIFFAGCNNAVCDISDVQATVVFDFRADDEKPECRTCVFVQTQENAWKTAEITVFDLNSDYFWRVENPVLLSSKVGDWAGCTNLLGENGDEDNYFTPDAPCVNVYNSADLIAYLQDGIWTMSDTQGRISLALGAAGDNARFIYDDSDRMIYRKEGSVLSKSIVTDRGLREWVNVTGSAGEALIWDGSKHSLICETEDGLLLRVSASETATVAEGVAESSLRRVLNSGGYLYRGSDGIYISTDFKGKPRLTSGGEITGDINRCAEYKGTIYIHAGNDLYAVEHMEFINELGDCEGLYVVGK